MATTAATKHEVYRAGDKIGPNFKSQFKSSQVWLFTRKELLLSSKCPVGLVLWKKSLTEDECNNLSRKGDALILEKTEDELPEEFQKGWSSVKVEKCEDGNSNFDCGYIERAVKHYIDSGKCNSVNDIAELKAACDWYWSFNVPKSLSKHGECVRIYEAVKQANKDWRKTLEEETKKGNVYVYENDDSDSSEISDLKDDIAFTDAYISRMEKEDEIAGGDVEPHKLHQPVKLKYQKQLYSSFVELACKRGATTLMNLILQHQLCIQMITADKRIHSLYVFDVSDYIKKVSECKLHMAVNRDDTKEVESLLQCGENVNGTDHNKETPLHWACAGGSSEMVNFLLDHGADMTAISSIGTTPMLRACAHNNYSAAHSLLKKDVASQTRDPKGCSPLHKAAGSNYPSLCELLMSQQMKPDLCAKDDKGRTPLHLTCLKVPKVANTDIVRLLIKNGSSVNSEDSFGWTPLHHAAFHNHTEAAELLLENKADPNVRTKFCPSDRVFLLQGKCKKLAVWICIFVFKHKMRLYHENVIKGERVNVSEYGQILIADYGEEPSKPLVNKVINAITKVGSDVKDETAMHLACKKGNQQVVRTLKKEKSVNLEITDADGFIPGDLAVIYRRRRTFEELHSIDVSKTDFKTIKKRHVEELDKQQKEAQRELAGKMQEIVNKLALPPELLANTKVISQGKMSDQLWVTGNHPFNPKAYRKLFMKERN